MQLEAQCPSLASAQLTDLLRSDRPNSGTRGLGHHSVKPGLRFVTDDGTAQIEVRVMLNDGSSGAQSRGSSGSERQPGGPETARQPSARREHGSEGAGNLVLMGAESTDEALHGVVR